MRSPSSTSRHHPSLQTKLSGADITDFHANAHDATKPAHATPLSTLTLAQGRATTAGRQQLRPSPPWLHVRADCHTSGGVVEKTTQTPDPRATCCCFVSPVAAAHSPRTPPAQ
jgi:hypothetical protein